MAWPTESGSIAQAKQRRPKRRAKALRSRFLGFDYDPPAPLGIFGSVYHYAGSRGDALRLKISGVEIQHLKAVGTIPGVAILQVAARNGPGTARIRSTGDGTYLSWRAPNSDTYGSRALCSSDGICLLEDGEDRDKYVRVQVFTDHLQPNPAEAKVYLKDVYENGVSHDDVTAGEASAGDVTAYTITLSNASTVGISQLKAWLDGAVVGLEISDDGIAYVVRDCEENPLSLADIPTGGSITFYLRRTISAGASSDTGVLSHLHFAWEGL